MSPGAGEGRQMSEPSSLSARSCQATGGLSGGPTGRGLGWAGQGGAVKGHEEEQGGVILEGELFCPGERGLSKATQAARTPPPWPPPPGLGVLMVSRRLLLPGRPGAAPSRGAVRVESCSSPGPPSRLFHQPHFDLGSGMLVTFDHKPGMLVGGMCVSDCG